MILIYAALFALSAISLLYKIRFGFPIEESVHIFTAVRFLQGDVPILHEWHGTQFSYLYLLPAVGLYLRINGSQEGIVLFCRTVFAVFWIIYSLFIYVRMRKITPVGAAFVSLGMILFVPYELMSVYYNTLGIAMIMSSSVIVITAERIKRIQYVLAGIMLAIAVTCCPVLAVMYLALTVMVVIELARKKREHVQIWVWMTVGIVISFILFCLFLLSRAGVTEYLNGIHHIFEDSEHQVSLAGKTYSYLLALCQPVPVILLWISCVLLAAYARRKDDRKFRLTGLLIVTVLTAVFVMTFVAVGLSLSVICIPVGIGLYCRICFPDKTNKTLFNYIWLPGFIYSLCINVTSNLGLGSINSALCISTGASIMMLACSITPADIGVSVKKKAYICLILSATVFYGVLIYNRTSYVFGETSSAVLDTYVDAGSARGLIVSKYSDNSYREYRNDFSEIKDNPDIDRVIALSNEQWLYLEMGKRLGAYTPWLHIYTPEMLTIFYNEYPQMKPDAVYIDKYYTSYSFFFEDMGYVSHRSPKGGLILYHE